MGASWSFFLCGELMTISAWKRGSAGTSISINCLGASGLSYCGYPKRSVPGAIFGEIFLLFYIIVLRNLYILILANFSVKTKNC